MFSGLERQRTDSHRDASVAWAWVKACGTIRSRTMHRASSKLTENILPSNRCHDEQVENWRDRLAAVACQKLARQICESFYNFSIFHSWRSRPAEAVATSRMLSPALPAYCSGLIHAKRESIGAERREPARILAAVLPPESEQRGAVLISLRPKAA
jgi:hypothetical protein